MEEIPGWIMSNYFYKEMNPFLRYAIVPFLILFNISVLHTLGAVLEHLGVLPTRFFLDNYLTSSLGIVGNLLSFVFLVNGVIIGILVLVSIPLWLFIRDARKTMERFGLLTTKGILAEQESLYLEVAQRIFSNHPDVSIYIFGHTHGAFLKKLGDRVVINSGTWLKILEHVPSRFKWLPDVYWPSFRLNFFRIREEEGKVLITYRQISKAAPRELSLLQRLAAARREVPRTIPEETILEV
jgi:hypothetical protein